MNVERALRHWLLWLAVDSPSLCPYATGWPSAYGGAGEVLRLRLTRSRCPG
jgi:hypothetical protein